MKEIEASQLKVGDIFYFRDSYREVVSDKRHSRERGIFVEVKCIMGPTTVIAGDGTVIGIGTTSFLIDYAKVLLLVRDGEPVC